jgi:hypothetical protein
MKQRSVWIVEQLSVGNKLARGEAETLNGDSSRGIKAIRSPIIVFASWGDNITPPQQALNCDSRTHDADEQEIKICGQRSTLYGA